MEIDKAQLVEMLRSRGDQDLADRVSRELPARVDPDQHRELFDGLDLDLDAGDAARHADEGLTENMRGLPTEEGDHR